MLRHVYILVLTVAVGVSTLELGTLQKTQSSSAFPCPEAADISPCICVASAARTTVEVNLELDCSAVTSEQELADVFKQSFPVTEFNKFSINWNWNITKLEDIFNNVTFQEIYLDTLPNLVVITDYFLENIKHVVKRIEIRGTKLTEETFPILLLERYTELTYLYLDNNKFRKIPQIESQYLTSVGFPHNPVDHLLAGEK